LNYLENLESQTAPFDIAAVPTVTKAQEEAEKQRQKAALQDTLATTLKATAVTATPQAAQAAALAATGANPQQIYAAAMEKVPELAILGNIIKSSKPVELTESETEYVVTCVKHIFAQHIVFQVRVVAMIFPFLTTWLICASSLTVRTL
jgi:coatomer protein complex subunit gamma